MSTLVEVLRPHRLDTLNQDSGKHCRCGSDSRFDGWGNMDEHRAAVVAEWLGSVEVREVVAEWLPDRSDIHARAILSALAAHAKGGDR